MSFAVTRAYMRGRLVFIMIGFFAAVVIGGASLAGGVGRISGTLVGALVLVVIRNGLNLLNVSSFWQQVVIGLVIAVAVGIDSLRRKNQPH